MFVAAVVRLDQSLFAGPLDFWTNRLTITNVMFQSGAYGVGKFVVAASFIPRGGAIFTSADGKEWRSTLDDPANYVLFGNGTFLAERTADDSWIHVSKNGEDWISRLPPGHELNGLRSLADFGLGRFWIQRETTTATLRYSSKDGMDWRLESTNAPSRIIQFAGDRFFAKTEPILKSFDGVNFTPADGWPRFDSIAYNLGIWVAVDSSSIPGAPPPGTVSVSTNGASWSTVNVTGQQGNRIELYTAGERFILTVGSNYFFESTDGLKWTAHKVVSGIRANYSKLTGVIYGADSLLVLMNYQEGFQKPVYTASSGTVFQSLPLSASASSILSASLAPALTLREGFTGAGYTIESAPFPSGPWTRETKVFPSSFPYVFLAPESENTQKFYRAVSE